MSEMQPVQFDRAEFSSASATATPCAQCKQPIIQSYYEVGGHLVCAPCRDALSQGTSSSRGRRFLRSFAAGLGAAILGAIVWWGVRKLTGYEVGIISIGVGIGVAKAIRWGTFGRGGRAYQFLAVLLTYTAVTLNYTPDVIEGMTSGENALHPSSFFGYAVVFVIGFVVAIAAPFLQGASHIIGIAIIGFGLFQAWKLTARVELNFNGPFSVAPAAPAPPVNA
jgi:hypothetical protein